MKGLEVRLAVSGEIKDGHESERLCDNGEEVLLPRVGWLPNIKQAARTKT